MVAGAGGGGVTGLVRVAAAQLAAGDDLDVNLATCVAAIDRAAEGGAALVVLPEFCNHLSWYADAAHCWQVAVELDGPWLGAIAARARRHRLLVVVNATVRRDGGACTGTSLLYGPDGALCGASDKQVLIGHENDFLRPASAPAPVIETAIGRLGLYACMDGVIAETPRALALRGAELLCNSLNSFALDEASLHVPVRAAENRVFVIAANKVGPLIPPALLAPVSAATAIPVEFLHGAGESQIVGPDGVARVRAGRCEPEVVFADVEPTRARVKRRPDGTDVFAARRPGLYRALAADPSTPAGATASGGASADRLLVAAVVIEAGGAAAVTEAAARVRELTEAGARLVVLPELCGGVGAEATAVIAALSAACAPGAHVVTSVVEARGDRLHHVGVAIDRGGVVLRQPQLHAVDRHAWAVVDAVAMAAPIAVLDLPWGRLAIVVGDDAIYPEVFRLAALAGAAVVAVPSALCEPWEAELGLVERAAENRVNLVAAAGAGPGPRALIATLPDDFTIMTAWRERRFDGLLSHPSVATGRVGVLRGAVHPAAAANKVVSHRTDLLAGRPWRLIDGFFEEVPGVD